MGSFQDMENNNEFIITIPAILCSFEWRNHPDALKLKEVSDAWVVDRCKRIPAACKSEVTAKLFSSDHLVQSAYYLLLTLYFANAVSTQRLLPMLKLMNWFFMLDTCVDEPSEFGADPTNATLLVESVMALFEPAGKSSLHHTTLEDGKNESSACNNIGSTSQNIVHELAHILTNTAEEWWSDMCVDMPLSQQARFSDIFKGYLRSILQETPFRSARHLPDVQTYMHIRSQTIGWYPLALLTEYTLCMEMDQEALTNPLLLALKQSVCESIFLVNDVMSFRKEYMRGDLFNIIMVLCFNKLLLLLQCQSLPNSWPCLATPSLLQECMFEACDMIQKRDQKCVRLIEEIKMSPLLMQKPSMGSFLEAMANNVSGNIYWHLTSQRYGLSAAHTQPPDLLASHNLHLSPIKL